MFTEHRETERRGIIDRVDAIGRCLSWRGDPPLTDHNFLPARWICTLHSVSFLHRATSVPCVVGIGCLSVCSVPVVSSPFSAVILHVSMFNGQVERAQPSREREWDDTLLRVTESG